jgi:hypothetical protein
VPGVTDTQSLRFGVDGESISYTTQRDLADDIATQLDAADALRNAVLRLPVVQLRRGAALAIPVTTITTIPWDTELEDSHGMWDAGSPTRVTAVAAAGTGLYMIDLFSQSDMTSWTRADLLLRRNGTFYSQKSYYNPQNFDWLQATWMIDLDTVGHYFEVAIYHEGGGTTNLLGGNTDLNVFKVST